MSGKWVNTCMIQHNKKWVGIVSQKEKYIKNLIRGNISSTPSPIFVLKPSVWLLTLKYFSRQKRPIVQYRFLNYILSVDMTHKTLKGPV